MSHHPFVCFSHLYYLIDVLQLYFTAHRPAPDVEIHRRVHRCQQLTFFCSAIPLSRFSLKMSRFFVANFELEQCALCALLSVKWNSEDSAINQLPVLCKANSLCDVGNDIVTTYKQGHQRVFCLLFYKVRPLGVSKVLTPAVVI